VNKITGRPKRTKRAEENCETLPHELVFSRLVELFEQTQSAMQMQAARSVDIALVARNWLFGWYIVEYQQNGSDRAEYGSNLLKTLSQTLRQKLGKGFSTDNLELMRKFYIEYSVTNSDELSNVLKLLNSETLSRNLPKSETASRNLAKPGTIGSLWQQSWSILARSFSLSWSHYVVLLTINSEQERSFYEIEARENAWGIRELKRQIGASLYERLALSRDKAGMKQLSAKGQVVTRPADILKSPYILEFLGLQEHSSYSENQLESAIIDKIEHFLLELGKGFLFEARQKRFTFDDDHFYVDLVFYNRLLRCYVLIDLKRDRLTHQDLGQMQMYVNYFDRYVKLDDEKPTVGILLCHSKHDDLVELTLPKDSNIYASEYQLYLPSKEELKKKLAEAQKEWELTNEA